MRTRASKSSNGFTLVEMMVVVVTLPLLFVIIDGLFRTLLAEIPWSLRLAEQNTTVLSMLRQMHQDVDKAKGLPEAFAGRTSNDKLLLIGLPDSVICYELKDGQVVREKLTKDEAQETRVWSAPNAKVEWKIWTENDRRYAVEVKTTIECNRRGQWIRKMANSHLFYVGVLR